MNEELRKKNGYRLVNNTWYPPGWTDVMITNDTLARVCINANRLRRVEKLRKRNW